ncbi:MULTISPECIES: START domain-containing protein [Pseudomonas syringae group]|uniref:START domain-containing protein n=2 Tax=Pseudomonas syringae group TaxID=136849 RepID=A0ABQ1DPC3_PSECI|nr:MULTISPECIES: START domain-containing protein [Pseudomonas syringae group]AHF68232.1 collagenase-related protease [Pseudomonas cichorii JBC1]MBI6852920.1 START domain-containing protein [Pseudomonas cichorii]MBX8484316.1 START domain-containing protein [Pseudomonas cichorii]MBX8498035.1 START domain-containing protein [Pseudomonas cichorii]MBX8501476.1 START domain-containing protein [Pseudomonas lijiangensis]
MNTLHRMAVVCGLTVLLTGVAQAEDWQVAKDEEGIKVSLSDVPGSKYKAYRGVTTINASVAKLRALQEDVVGACAWIHECQSQKLLKHEGNKAWTYTRFNTPWPVTPRDSILLITSEEGADGSLTRNIDEQSSYLPEEKGFVRVAEVKGFWKLVPKGPNLTEVTYQVHTDPGGSVPSWVANKFVVDAPFNTLKALKERSQK